MILNPAYLIPRIDPAHVSLRGRSLPEIVGFAYGVKIDDIQCDERVRHPRFDVEAKLPAGASVTEVPQMLQSLLADRFKLVIRKDLKPSAAYALVTSPGGPSLKLKESIRDDTHPAVCSAGRCGGMDCRRMTMAGLAQRLSYTFTQRELGLDAPVVDSTGLKGAYDFSLDFELASTKPPEDCESSGGTIYSALKAVGLSLRRHKQEQMREFIVIESALLVPTAD